MLCDCCASEVVLLLHVWSPLVVEITRCIIAGIALHIRWIMSTECHWTTKLLLMWHDMAISRKKVISNYGGTEDQIVILYESTEDFPDNTFNVPDRGAFLRFGMTTVSLSKLFSSC
jgi:hypothetical protein